MSSGIYQYDIPIALPNTNFKHFCEHRMLADLGDCQWKSIASTIGVPMSEMRTFDGGEVYATFFYIQENFPVNKRLETFRLDSSIRVINRVKGFKNISVNGEIIFDEKSRIAEWSPEVWTSIPASIKDQVPHILFGNIFIASQGGNDRLKLAPSVVGDFSKFTPIEPQENFHSLTKHAQINYDFGLLDSNSWEPVSEWLSDRYTIDPDRDSNGAGLVYFANYISFMDRGERQALEKHLGFSFEKTNSRSTLKRRVAYYGNATLKDSIKIETQTFRHSQEKNRIAFRARVVREKDQQLICFSEAIKWIDI